MSVDTQYSVPTSFRLGLDFDISIPVGEFESSDVAHLYIENSDNDIDIAATDGDGYFNFDVLSADTDDWAVGDCRWYIVVTSNSKKYEHSSGDIELLPVLGSNTDHRTFAEKMLDLIETELESRATGSAYEKRVDLPNGMQMEVKKMKLSELRDERSRYLEEVSAQKLSRLGYAGTYKAIG